MRILADPRHDCPHRGDLRADGRAAGERKLAHHEIDRLNAVGALVDGCDARIAQVLRCTCLLDISHAAMNLDPSEATSTPISVENALATGVSSDARSCAFRRAFSSPSRCARSRLSAVM